MSLLPPIPFNAGSPIAASTPMIAITTSNSISVKATALLLRCKPFGMGRFGIISSPASNVVLVLSGVIQLDRIRRSVRPKRPDHYVGLDFPGIPRTSFNCAADDFAAAHIDLVSAIESVSHLIIIVQVHRNDVRTSPWVAINTVRINTAGRNWLA